MDSFQRLFWSIDGRVSPRRHCTNTSVLEQAAGCDTGDLVEDVQSTDLASEREERSAEDARYYGYERTSHA